jgi:hypothetical protein
VENAAAFLIDGMLSGTGVRDAFNGGYLDPRDIGLSEALTGEIADWQQRYEEAHFDGFPEGLVAQLDQRGLAFVAQAKAELPDIEIGYFSSGLLKRLG